MVRSRPMPALAALVALVAAGSLAACAGGGFSSMGGRSPEAAPPPGPPVVPSVRADDLVGRWGVASFQKPEDRARTETAARGQCGQPYTITKGSSGGVMMYLADNPALQELTIKANSSGTYIGPSGEAGGMSDREVVSFDGRAMVLRWIDPEVASRYGTTIYVRCAASGTPTARRSSTGATR